MGITLSRLYSILIVSVCAFISACQTPPSRLITEEELESTHQGFIDTYKNELDEVARRSFNRIRTEYENAAEHKDNESQSFDVLVLSGGGAFGAFGAGFLQGWGEVNDKEFKRPQFDTVSGISTGALIAPFAFLGTKESYETIIELYENPKDDWVRERGLVPYLPGNISLYDISKLHKTVRTAITPELIKSISVEGSRNRQLLIGTTNVDYGVMRVWSLIKVAQENSAENAAAQASNILLASSAIPGVFPPIVIDDFLYVDGGATMQVVSGIDDRSWLYDRDTAELSYIDTDRPIRIRIWMIINQKLLPDHELVSSRWTSIAGRSLNVLLRASTLQSIQDTETFIQMIDQVPEFDAEFRYVAIPQEFEIDDSDKMFDADVMRKLTALGREIGANPASWRTRALLPGAPF